MPPKRTRVLSTEPPEGFQPLQQPRLVAAPPSGPGWRHEIKLDGYRMQLRVGRAGPGWFSRNGHDWTARLPDIAGDAMRLPPGVYDGELCVLDAAGSPVFSALRKAMGSRQVGAIKGDLTYFIFDQLFEGACDLQAEPLSERLAHLNASALGDSARLRLAPEAPGQGEALLKAACQLGLEGIVSKRLTAPYEPSQPHRALSWVKSKCRPAQEVVIGGWEMTGPRFRSLLVGVYDGSQLRYVGAIGTGFSAEVTSELMARLRAVETPVSPFQIGAAPRTSTSTHWARPELVAAAEIAEWTAAGQLRQASFKGLREDKPARDVQRERPMRES